MLYKFDHSCHDPTPNVIIVHLDCRTEPKMTPTRTDVTAISIAILTSVINHRIIEFIGDWNIPFRHHLLAYLYVIIGRI